MRLCIYIPLCFYFIGIIEKCYEEAILNLHSTMLLLYQLIRVQKVPGKRYLHSTMLLLYHVETLATAFNMSNLHSTMLLLYQCYKARLADGFSDLHSTMLLLYLRIRKPVKMRYRIYIPLCFYFIDI